MLRPQKKGWLLSPRKVGARRDGPGPSVPGNCGSVVPAKRKGREMIVGDAILKPKELPLCGVGDYHAGEQSQAEVWRRFREAGFLDEAVLQRRDRDALAHRISELEKELYQYQYHMGLLLIEKKEWAGKYEKIREEMSEAVQIQKRMQAAHIVAVSEFEKQEENMRKVMGFQRQSIVNLEKALNEMHADTAEVKLEYQKKLSEVHALEATVEEKYLEIKGKMHSLDTRLAEVGRKSLEIDRRLEDVEARERKLHKESSSFITEKMAFEKDLAQQIANLGTQEQELQDNQKRLAEWHSFLNERETEAHEKDNTLKRKEKKLEEACKTMEISNDSIKLKEEDICMQHRALHAKEKETAIEKEFLEKKEKELLAIKEQLSNGERVDIQEIIHQHNSILESKKEEFELETKKMRRAVDEQLKGRIDAMAHKETMLENRKREILGKEQLLEREMGNLKNRDKENVMMLNALKEAIGNEKEELKLERVKLEKEWELLGEKTLSLEQGFKQLSDEKERFDQWRGTEEERFRKGNMEMSGHIQLNLEDSRLNEESSKDKTAYQKMDALEVFNGENVHIADEVDVHSMQQNQEQVKETLPEKENDSNRRSNVILNYCNIVSNLNEGKFLKLKEQEDQLKSEKMLLLLGKKSDYDRTTSSILSQNNNDKVEEHFEGGYLLAPAEQRKACRNCGFKDGGDAILSGESPEVSDLGTCPGSVKLEARILHMRRCSRLLNFSPDKRVTEHSDKSVCLDGEPLEPENNLESGPLLGDVNASQWAQCAGGIQDNAEPERSNKDDATKNVSEISDRSTDILKLQSNSPRNMEEPTLPCADEQKDREGNSVFPELDSVPQTLKQKQCPCDVRRRSVFVKKSRSVNALMKDADLEDISQSKHNEQSTYKGKKLFQKCLEEGYSFDGDHVAVSAEERSLSFKHGMMSTEPEGSYAEVHSEDLSSLGCSEEMQNCPVIEIPGLERYNFRHSTIVRAVTVSQGLACRTKRKNKGGPEPLLENKVLKVAGNDDEEAQSHACSSESLSQH